MQPCFFAVESELYFSFSVQSCLENEKQENNSSATAETCVDKAQQDEFTKAEQCTTDMPASKLVRIGSCTSVITTYLFGDGCESATIPDKEEQSKNDNEWNILPKVLRKCDEEMSNYFAEPPTKEQSTVTDNGKEILTNHDDKVIHKDHTKADGSLRQELLVDPEKCLREQWHSFNEPNEDAKANDSAVYPDSTSDVMKDGPPVALDKECNSILPEERLEDQLNLIYLESNKMEIQHSNRSTLGSNISCQYSNKSQGVASGECSLGNQIFDYEHKGSLLRLLPNCTGKRKLKRNRDKIESEEFALKEDAPRNIRMYKSMMYHEGKHKGKMRNCQYPKKKAKKIKHLSRLDRKTERSKKSKRKRKTKKLHPEKQSGDVIDFKSRVLARPRQRVNIFFSYFLEVFYLQITYNIFSASIHENNVYAYILILS